MATTGTHSGDRGCGSASSTAENSSGCGGHADAAGHTHTVLDPVCGMSVEPETSKHRFDHRGETFHFCSATCRERFAADPARYLDKSKPEAAPPAGAVYTCPMHPEVRQVGPGSCPVCGMALEAEVASLDHRPIRSLPT